MPFAEQAGIGRHFGRAPIHFAVQQAGGALLHQLGQLRMRCKAFRPRRGSGANCGEQLFFNRGRGGFFLFPRKVLPHATEHIRRWFVVPAFRQIERLLQLGFVGVIKLGKGFIGQHIPAR